MKFLSHDLVRCNYCYKWYFFDDYPCRCKKKQKEEKMNAIEILQDESRTFISRFTEVLIRENKLIPEQKIWEFCRWTSINCRAPDYSYEFMKHKLIEIIK